MGLVPHVLGVAHPTGYPTYILLAWLTELIPIGSVAFRANVLSAVLVAIALATVTAFAERLGVRTIVAIAAGLALATGWLCGAAVLVVGGAPSRRPTSEAIIAGLGALALALWWWADRRRTANSTAQGGRR